MSSDVAVYVAVGRRNLLAGRLYPYRRRGVESASFIYDDRYLADLDAYSPLGLTRQLSGRARAIAARLPRGPR